MIGWQRRRPAGSYTLADAYRQLHPDLVPTVTDDDGDWPARSIDTKDPEFAETARHFARLIDNTGGAR